MSRHVGGHGPDGIPCDEIELVYLAECALRGIVVGGKVRYAVGMVPFAGTALVTGISCNGVSVTLGYDEANVWYFAPSDLIPVPWYLNQEPG